MFGDIEKPLNYLIKKGRRLQLKEV